MLFERFFSDEPLVLEGSVIDKSGKTISIEIHPGFVIEVQKKDTTKVEESTDPLTGRALVKVTLKPDAGKISAVFQPKLAREAVGEKVPFTVGGPRRRDKDKPPAGGGPGKQQSDQQVAVSRDSKAAPEAATTYPTIGTFYTSSYNPFWGYVNDDTRYSDWGTYNTVSSV